MRKEDIVFVFPLSRVQEHRYAIGVLLISAFLRENGYDNIIIEPHKLADKKFIFNEPSKEFLENLMRNLIKKLKELQPKIVGIGAATVEFNEVMNTISKIKKNINTKIVVGGYHANAIPEDFLRYNKDYNADFVVVGEGEFTMLDLVKALDNKMAIENIDGLVWKNKGKVIRNKPRKLIEDLDILPLPAYDKIDMEHYLSIWDGTIRGIPLRACLIMTSRGCPYDCSFCGCNAIFGRKVRYHGPNRIEKEIRLLKERYNVEALFFADDMLTVSQKHLEGVCDIAKKYDLLFECQGRVNTTTEDSVKKLKDSGCIQIDLGVESGSQRILDEIIDKKITIEQVKKAFKTCKKYKLRALANFMIGFPTETKEEMDKTLQLAKEINADFYVLQITTPFPGTRLFSMIGEKLDPKDYHKLDFDRFLPRFNKSEAKDLVAMRRRFYKSLNRIIVRNSARNTVFFIKMWLKLPRKIGRAFYMIKKATNYFIIRPILGRSIRL